MVQTRSKTPEESLRGATAEVAETRAAFDAAAKAHEDAKRAEQLAGAAVSVAAREAAKAEQEEQS